MRNCNSLPNKQPANSLLKKFQFIIATATIFGKVTKKNCLLLGNSALYQIEIGCECFLKLNKFTHLNNHVNQLFW